MTITLDKVFSCSLVDFYEIEDNYQKYKEYNIVNVNRIIHPDKISALSEYAALSIPENTEVVVNFKVTPLNSSSHYVSGLALVPKPNDQGGQNDSNN